MASSQVQNSVDTDGGGGSADDSSGGSSLDAPGSAPDGGVALADGVVATDGSTSGDGSATTKTDSSAPTDAHGGESASDASTPFKGVANSACSDLGRLGVSWFYNWTLNGSGCTASPFVPMIWGHTGMEQTAAGITSEIDGLVSAGYEAVLGFNEPDNTSQSNISEAMAISLWPSFTANPKVLVGSPATQANSTGQAWFTSFMKAVNADTTGTLRVDFIAAHWYGWNSGSCDANASQLESYVKWLEAIPGNRPIWLTEWGCLNQSNPSEAVVQAFFSGAVTMFAKHPRVERYAWYPWTTNNELVADGGLTSLGAVFAAEPSYR
jgi:hypothetical protein